ncbi:MAG TPA: hypothetical protein PKM22_15800, partial [Candidatus Hydrogenedentes bacterium]|nr:hypothetical protein [Candidatus Hydrogenedentota bacterium]
MRTARGTPAFVRALALLAAVMGLTACATRPPELPRAYPVPCIWPTPPAARLISSDFGEVR